eukprot:TRINITY_DN8970_c0_g4_i1.p1 TRINITY_DN8970_c0_g4~~TRINITY_DN8970_c0_g4_i1.p1  ORF type:complete len:495 (-),score=99.75 TRINITY_DN8970_c0_g4_i1:127-1539(-)
MCSAIGSTFIKDLNKSNISERKIKDSSIIPLEAINIDNKCNNPLEVVLDDINEEVLYSAVSPSKRKNKENIKSDIKRLDYCSPKKGALKEVEMSFNVQHGDFNSFIYCSPLKESSKHNQELNALKTSPKKVKQSFIIEPELFISPLKELSIQEGAGNESLIDNIELNERVITIENNMQPHEPEANKQPNPIIHLKTATKVRSPDIKEEQSSHEENIEESLQENSESKRKEDSPENKVICKNLKLPHVIQMNNARLLTLLKQTRSNKAAPMKAKEAVLNMSDFDSGLENRLTVQGEDKKMPHRSSWENYRGVAIQEAKLKKWQKIARAHNKSEEIGKIDMLLNKLKTEKVRLNHNEVNKLSFLDELTVPPPEINNTLHMIEGPVREKQIAVPEIELKAEQKKPSLRGRYLNRLLSKKQDREENKVNSSNLTRVEEAAEQCFVKIKKGFIKSKERCNRSMEYCNQIIGCDYC